MDGRNLTLSAPTGVAIAREWARSWCTRTSAALLLVFLFSSFSAFSAVTAAHITLGVKLAGVLIISFMRPAWGVVIGALLLPIVTVLQQSTDVTIDVALLLVGVIVCGALLRLGSNTDRSVRWPAVVALAAAIVLSCIHAVGPSRFADGIRQIAAAQPAVVWLTGLGLALVAARIARQHRRTGQIAARVLIIGAAMVAAASWVAVVKVAADFPRPLSAALDILIRARVSTVFADPNAAGSYFALFAVAAAWLCVASDRRWRWRWLPILFVIGIALWLSGSRTAAASACIALVAAWAAARRPRAPVLLTAVVCLALALSYLIFASPSRPSQASSSYAVRVRVEMAEVALAIARAHPLLGVGPGNFQAASRPFISPDLVARFPPAAAGENAHNNFLQVLAELGVAGLVAFVGLLIAPLRSGWRALRVSESAVEGVALSAGAAAFLITCLAGHPLLNPEVMLAFFFSLGLGYGLTTDAASMATE